MGRRPVAQLMRIILFEQRISNYAVNVVLKCNGFLCRNERGVRYHFRFNNHLNSNFYICFNYTDRLKHNFCNDLKIYFFLLFCIL